MAKCFNCGREYEGNFCPDCGTVNSESGAQQIPAPAPAPAPVVQPQPQRFTPPPVYNNVTIQQQNVTSIGGWIGWMFLIALLPLLGLIIMLCCTHDESAKNFAKAQLVFILITVAICIAIAVLIGIFAGSTSSF